MAADSEALDQAILQLALRGRSWTIGEAIHAARVTNVKGSPQVTVEVVLTEGGHPFDLLSPKALRGSTRHDGGNGSEVLAFEDDEGIWVVSCLETGESGVFLVVGGSAVTGSRWQRVERWLNSAHGIFRCYLNHSEFATIGDDLSELGDVEVSRFTARVVTDQSSITRGFPAVEPRSRPDHRGAIVEAETNMASVRTLTLSVRDVLSVHLRRVAGATFYSGEVAAFESVVIHHLVAAATKRRSFMSGRSRSESDGIRPVSIQLERPVFNSREDTGQLVSLLNDLARFSVAVFHRNPYLHVAVTDENDGSNFDVMVTDSDRIEIFPGFRASLPAISRLSTILGERFGSSEMTDSSRARVSVAELMR